MSFEITERWLMDSGGWPAMKAARASWQAGAVLAVEYDGTRLRGQVRGGGKTFAAGLLIKSKTDVTNLCPCPQSRRDGALCEHSLALGLAWVAQAKSGGASPAAGKTAGAAAAAGASSTAGRGPVSAAPLAPKTSGPLAVTLPPAFFTGLSRQRLGFSLRAVSASATVTETAADRAIHAWLAAQKLDRVPPQLALAGQAQIESFLLALRGHPRVTLGSKPLAIPPDPPLLPLRALTENPQKSGSPGSSGDSEDADDAGQVVLQPDFSSLPGAEWWGGARSTWAYAPGQATLLAYDVPEDFAPLFAEEARQHGVARSISWLIRHGQGLAALFEIDEDDPAWPRFKTVAGASQFRLHLDGSLQAMAATLWCRYGSSPEFPLPASAQDRARFPLQDPQQPEVFYERNDIAEAAALARLQRAGFAPEGGGTRLLLRHEAEFLQFYAGELPRLEAQWTVEYSARAREALRSVERITPSFRPVASGTNWLAFDLALAGSQGTTISQADARRWLQAGQGHRRLPNGKLAVLAKEQFADLDEVLRDLQPDQAGGNFRIKKAQLGYLEASIPRQREKGRAAADEFAAAAPPLSEGWKKILRGYQQHGADWMLRQAAQGLGGILADEMGLGKTVQTLAVIATLRAAHPGGGPCLVTAPTSLLGNWEAEAARFAPGLRVLTIRSGERSEELAALASGAADLVITSYPLLVRDTAHHTKVGYRAVFLDEAGFVRNPDTQASKAVRRLQAHARFALTGTPIENSVRDLWAIMEFAVPGYLGRRDDFRDRYEAPLQAGAAATLDRLRRRMAPYWLRRLKQDVARELPAKIEKIVPCELTSIQREIYTAIQREGVRKIDEARRSQTAAQARLTMLTTLLRMRQTCGDPRLLGETFDGQNPEDFSGKWAALTELLEEIRDGGHSVLIFSQFATQLRLLQETVRQSGLDFCHLDGSSTDREAQIAAFRDDPSKRVFLISLKAGGFGLNLTKADCVIHFDPWWNPAVEAQATDRAHRIGQLRPVTVYKLIAAGTVEEKILALQKQKRHLMETALDDTSPLMDGLQEAELRALVAG